MTKENIFQGKARVFGDFVDAYQILPQVHWKGGTKIERGAEDLGEFAMAGADPGFAAEALAGKYSFIVAGRNFAGGGKSIEHPIYAIKGAGIKAVIAESCSRYFFRNAINNGLLIMICDGITANVKTGDELKVNPSTGEIRNVTTDTHFRSAPMPDIAVEILNMGGYIPYVKKKIAMK